MKQTTGVIRGATIELREPLDLPDGTEVEVSITPRPVRSAGRGLARCGGAMAEFWTDEDDGILAEIEQSRGGPPRDCHP
jgi:hypothetical protein